MRKPDPRISKYVQDHHKIQTKTEMAGTLGVQTQTITLRCKKLGIAPITPLEQKIKAIRASRGKKTPAQLAAELNCCREWIRVICHRYGMPYKDEWGGARIKKRVGRPPLMPPVLEEFKKIVRPKEGYSNPQYDKIIDQILNT